MSIVRPDSMTHAEFTQLWDKSHVAIRMPDCTTPGEFAKQIRKGTEARDRYCPEEDLGYFLARWIEVRAKEKMFQQSPFMMNNDRANTEDFDISHPWWLDSAVLPSPSEEEDAYNSPIMIYVRKFLCRQANSESTAAEDCNSTQSISAPDCIPHTKDQQLIIAQDEHIEANTPTSEDNSEDDSSQIINNNQVDDLSKVQDQQSNTLLQLEEAEDDSSLRIDRGKAPTDQLEVVKELDDGIRYPNANRNQSESLTYTGHHELQALEVPNPLLQLESKPDDTSRPLQLQQKIGNDTILIKYILTFILGAGYKHELQKKLKQKLQTIHDPKTLLQLESESESDMPDDNSRPIQLASKPDDDSRPVISNTVGSPLHQHMPKPSNEEDAALPEEEEAMSSQMTTHVPPYNCLRHSHAILLHYCTSVYLL